LDLTKNETALKEEKIMKEIKNIGIEKHMVSLV